jgi:GAF domain-containing protein
MLLQTLLHSQFCHTNSRRRPVPEDAYEADRLESLRSYAILDTDAEAPYDELTLLAAMVCNAPVALVSLVDADRQWFMSHYGTDLQQTDLCSSICAHAVADSAPLVIGDTTRDALFADHDAVTGPLAVKAYAGIPLVGRDGLPLGSLCVLDRRPRRFNEAQIRDLTTLAGQVGRRSSSLRRP